MAYVNTTNSTNSVLANAIHAVQSATAKIVSDMAKKRMYRTTVKELSALHARELADLGIHRSQIKAIAYEGAYGLK